MRRALLICLLYALCTAGCALVAREQAPAATPAPTPTPEPAPVLAVLGGREEDGFLDMIRSIAASAACDFAALEEDGLEKFRPRGRAALILYLDEETPDMETLNELAERGVLLYAYAARGQTLPEGLAGLRYDSATAAGTALEEAIGYRNHDTPVRLLGLFTAEDSPAHTVWAEAVAEGRVLERGAYVEQDARESAQQWLTERLDGLYAGMLDGVCCESAEQARVCAEALKKQARDDLEIFCAAADGTLLQSMHDTPWPLVRAVGAEPAEAGRLCAEQAIVLLYGGTAQELTIAPSIFAAS